MRLYYTVEIGGSDQDKRLGDFMDAVEELASQYRDIQVEIISEFYK